MNAQIRFYNPREASPELLEAILVGRDGIIQEILDDLARQATSASRQHWLIRGPRGIGKTHLIGILYHRVQRDPALAKRLLPVWLAETDAYSVYSAAVLLLQIAERLAEELRLAGDPGAGELARKVDGLAPGGDDPALFEETCEILKEEARSRGKILVVLMENLDALLAGLPGQRGAQEVRRLRSLLSQDKEFLFLSTTPTQYLAEVSDPKQPLYGHLKERSLKALTEDEVGRLLRRLAKVTGQTERLAPLQEEREGRVRRRVLHRLTGGNPRAVVMAFTVLSGAQGVQAMVEEMNALLDTQTAYFEARLARLAPRERAILAAMALATKNLTLQEIAGLTRLPLRSLSVQVDRLREQGYLSITAGDGGKGTIYEVSDGLFRIWYQYRKGRKVLKPIVEILALWYADEELEKTLLTLRSFDSEAPLVTQREASELSELQVREALTYSRSSEGRLARQQLWSTCGDEPKGTDVAWKALLTWLDGLPRKEEPPAWKAMRRELVLSDSPETRWLHTALSVFRLNIEAESPETLHKTCYLLAGSGFADLASEVELRGLQRWGDLGCAPESQHLIGDLLPHRMVNAVTLRAFSVAIDRLSHQDTRPKLDHLLRAGNAVKLMSQGHEERSAQALAVWADSLAADRDAVLSDTIPVVLVTLLISPTRTKDVLQVLARGKSAEVVESVRLQQSLIDVLDAQSDAGDTGRQNRPRGQADKALAQVPPELREAVNQFAQSLRTFWRVSSRLLGKKSVPRKPGSPQQ